jgi:phosphonate transport system permease protein
LTVPVEVAPSRETTLGAPGPPLRPPWDRRRVTLLLTLVLAAVATGLSLRETGVAVTTLAEGAGDIWALLGRMVPPRFTDLPRTVDLVLETFFMAFAGTVLALVLSVPLALFAARTTTFGWATFGAARALITAFRAIPDLVFALVFVRAIGLGVLPGILALGLHSIGMVGKLIADAVEEIDTGPLDAARATGATRAQVLSAGVLPQIVPTVIGLFLYRLEINVRLSTVLGFVGAGGIGMQLRATLGNLRYQEALGIVVVIFGLILVVEGLSMAVRRTLLEGDGRDSRAPLGAGPGVKPPWTGERRSRLLYGALFVVVLVASVAATRVTPVDAVLAVPDIWEVVTRFLPPDFGDPGSLWAAMVETVSIGVAATALGAALSVPLALLGSRNIARRRPVYLVARGVVVLVRSVPEIVLAVIFVAAVGLGPFAGVLALGIWTIGFMAKLLGDALEQVSQAPRDAIDATGATGSQQTVSAVVPQIMPAFVGTLLYMVDINVRSSVVVGIVGAGGVGFLLVQSIRTLDFPLTAAILICIFVVVYAIERLSDWLRKQLI